MGRLPLPQEIREIVLLPTEPRVQGRYQSTPTIQARHDLVMRVDAVRIGLRQADQDRPAGSELALEVADVALDQEGLEPPVAQNVAQRPGLDPAPHRRVRR